MSKEFTLFNIGITLIVIGFVFILINIMAHNEKSETKFAIGGIIGFIPFGFANDKKILILTIIISIVLFILSVFYVWK